MGDWKEIIHITVWKYAQQIEEYTIYWKRVLFIMEFFQNDAIFFLLPAFI